MSVSHKQAYELTHNTAIAISDWLLHVAWRVELTPEDLDLRGIDAYIAENGLHTFLPPLLSATPPVTASLRHQTRYEYKTITLRESEIARLRDGDGPQLYIHAYGNPVHRVVLGEAPRLRRYEPHVKWQINSIDGKRFKAFPLQCELWCWEQRLSGFELVARPLELRPEVRPSASRVANKESANCVP